jgi:hypothetical protein
MTASVPDRVAIPVLGGTGLLADDLYLAAHDDGTGRPRLAPRQTGIGLAGGLLAELLLVGLIEAGPLAVTAVAGEAGAGDDLGRQVLGQVARETGRLGVREWLDYLSLTAAEAVAGRLAGAGYLVPVTRRWPLRERLVPASPDCAVMAVTRACAALDPAREARLPGLVLAALAGACGLGPVLREYATASARRPGDITPLLPPRIRPLIIATVAAADSAVLTAGL